MLRAVFMGPQSSLDLAILSIFFKILEKKTFSKILVEIFYFTKKNFFLTYVD